MTDWFYTNRFKRLDNNMKLNKLKNSSTLYFCCCFLVLWISQRPTRLYSQNAPTRGRQIDSCFKVLALKDDTIINQHRIDKVYFPFYTAFYFQNSLLEQKVISGASCTEYIPSVKLQTLKKIYLIFSSNDETYMYNLVDSLGRPLYDLVRYNCSGMGEKLLGHTVSIHQKELNEVIESYQRWYQILKQDGYSKIKELGLYPSIFSKYKWVKEIGYISEQKTNIELLKIFETILSDTLYQSYFIKRHNLKGLFNNEISNKELLAKIMLITLVNNEMPFTDDVSKFTFYCTSTDNTKSYSEIINTLIKMVKSGEDLPIMDELLKQYGLIITLR